MRTPAESPNRSPRRALRASLTLGGTLAVSLAAALVAAPAHAEPAGWPTPEPVSLVTALAVYVFIPLALVAVISLLTLAPSLRAGRRDESGVATEQWFGGPRPGTHELPAPADRAEKTGGASGDW